MSNRSRRRAYADESLSYTFILMAILRLKQEMDRLNKIDFNGVLRNTDATRNFDT